MMNVTLWRRVWIMDNRVDVTWIEMRRLGKLEHAHEPFYHLTTLATPDTPITGDTSFRYLVENILMNSNIFTSALLLAFTFKHISLMNY